MDQIKSLQIEICYATINLQISISLVVLENTSIYEALLQSGLLSKYQHEINLTINQVGIYGKLKSLNTILKENDRIEIYRPLIFDPKDMRRQGKFSIKQRKNRK